MFKHQNPLVDFTIKNPSSWSISLIVPVMVCALMSPGSFMTILQWWPINLSKLFVFIFTHYHDNNCHCKYLNISWKNVNEINQ
jgi:hypothetical protein